jgi:hypothetical protein
MANRVNIKVPRSLWTAKDTMRLAQNALASIKLRTSKGLDADEEPFAEYSQTPIYVSTRGARLKPKGGRPSRTGNSIFYEGGYQQYKEESRSRSREGGDSAEVDLVLSGNMMNNLVVKEATENMFIIGLTSKAQYGYAVNEERRFLGLSKKDIETLVEAVEIEVRKKLLR